MLPDALDRALTMLESQRLAVPHGGHQGQYDPAAAARPEPYRGQFSSPQRIDALADVLLAHYPNGVGMPLIVEDDHSGDVANAYATSLAQRLPQHVVHIRSFSKSHGPDSRWLRCLGRRMPGGDYHPTTLGIGMGEPVPARDSV